LPLQVFLAFADSRFARSRRRLAAQAADLDLFDRIITLDELALERRFVRQKADFFARRTRGFGFWVWKPYLIERALNTLSDDDVLVYSDVGNHFDAANKYRLAEYVQMAKTARLPILSPALSNAFPEIAWSKRELLAYFGVSDDFEILQSPQREANFIIAVNSPSIRRLVRAWNEVHECSLSLFDDSIYLEQDSRFVAHRHDQSAFSILSKLSGAASLPPSSDDFVLRKRDKVQQQAHLRYLAFLAKNGLLVDHLDGGRKAR
jgi:hypothetical protein